MSLTHKEIVRRFARGEVAWLERDVPARAGEQRRGVDFEGPEADDL